MKIRRLRGREPDRCLSLCDIICRQTRRGGKGVGVRTSSRAGLSPSGKGDKTAGEEEVWQANRRLPRTGPDRTKHDCPVPIPWLTAVPHLRNFGRVQIFADFAESQRRSDADGPDSTIGPFDGQA